MSTSRDTSDASGASGGTGVRPGIDLEMIRLALNLFLDDLQYQLASLVDQIHHLNVAHGDFKPENIGYHWQADGPRLYALDFGHACPITAISHRTGSMAYMDSLTLKGFALELIQKHENDLFAQLFIEADFETEDIKLLVSDVDSAQKSNQAGPKPFDYFALTRILREIATPDEPVPTFDIKNAKNFRVTVLTLAAFRLENESESSKLARDKLSTLLKKAEAELHKSSEVTESTKESEAKAPAPKDPATEEFLANMIHPNRAVRAAYPLMESVYIQQKIEAHGILQRPEYAPILSAFKTILTS